MNKVTKIVISIIALVFMLTFTVMLVISMANSNLMGGKMFYVAIACGLCGIVLYILIARDNRMAAEIEMLAKAEEERLDATKNNKVEDSCLDEKSSSSDEKDCCCGGKSKTNESKK